MERLLISLTPEMRQWLEKRAASQGISMAAIVRMLIRRAIEDKEIS